MLSLSAVKCNFLALMAGFLALTSAVHAQDAVIHAGHLILPGQGQVIDNQYITVSDGVVRSVSGELPQNWKGEVINLKNSWVMPGLIDCHTHITLDFPPGDFDFAKQMAKESNALRALIGLKHARELLRAGFTTIKEVGNDGNYVAADIMKAIHAGWFDGPTIVYSGKIIAPYGGQLVGVSPDAGRPWEYEYLVAETPEEIVKAIHQNMYYGARAVKMVADDQPYYYSREMIAAAVDEAHRLGMTVTVHTLGGEAARNVILGGADGIEHGFNLDQEHLELMKQRGTWLIGTDFTLDHLRAMHFTNDLGCMILSQTIIARLKLANEMGVKMAFGTDIVMNLPGKDRVNSTLAILETWKAAGIPSMEILKCMTVNGADWLGLKGTRGDIETGAAADIIAMPEDPLRDVSNLSKVNFVMKEGRVVRFE